MTSVLALDELEEFDAEPSWSGPLTIPAAVIAVALGLPRPTADQAAVIEAPPAPAIVIAGAGSGKTETMAGRVVWLVANGHVRADEVLGLTFTRKAAGELAERIQKRLSTIGEYERRGLLPHLERIEERGDLARFWDQHAGTPPRDRQAAFGAMLDGLAVEFGTAVRSGSTADDLLQRARVSTYNSFADAIVREHGARIGRDPDSALLSQSGSWLLARRVVIGSQDERLAEREEAFSTVVDAVHRLAGEVLDNRVDLDELAAFGERWAGRLADVSCRLKKHQDLVAGARKNLSGLPVLAGLIADYATRKHADDTLDFADQVAGALQIVEAAPDVAAELRDQYRVVLLDEYQDTSVIQTDLLAAIFHDTAVMAVGDPQQSIYGWRGASADNLAAFPRAFARTTAASRHGLMISWRNDLGILTAANAILAGGAAGTVGVERLAARPGAREGRVAHVFAASVDDEAREVADWFARVRAEHAATTDAPHSGAVLFRTKRHMQLFSDALNRAGVPNRILGLGGLLSAPEVVDVISALRVVHDPSQGSALLRILSGPRFSIGVPDLAALHALAETLARRDATLTPFDDELAQRIRGSAGADEQVSIIDALEFVRRAADEYRLLADISPEGRARLREAGELFERLRRAVGQPIPDLIRMIELELRLDIELAANESRGPARIASSRLRSFLDEVRSFLLADDRGSIGSLLAWLDHAEETDELMPRPEPPEPGVVQLLTIHGSKGLEWDAVAVVRLVEQELPKAPRTVAGWLGFGVLPYALRGDRDALPRLAWDHADDDVDLAPAIEAFREADRAHQEREERRLAYVAVTRARSDLLLTGAHWAGQQSARKPSRYLQDMLVALGRDEIDASDPGENPYLEQGGRILSWPLDPLGDRCPLVERAAAEVAAAAERSPQPDAVLEPLLREAERRRRGQTAEAPARIGASRFKDFVGDYGATVRAIARPLPERPYGETLRGTLFHAWVEQRSGIAGRGGSLDDALWELDEDVPETEVSIEEEHALAQLKATFEASEWGPLQPIEVETEIDITLAGAEQLGHVICKLDAVYRRTDRGGRIEIVDWKTGRPPTSAADREERMLQLALYRLAYHKRHGVPLEEIDVALYYVGANLVIRSDRVYSEEELVQRWNAAREARSASTSSSTSAATSDGATDTSMGAVDTSS
ncbi:ATP-dependent helicase [Microbacterium sp. 4R-513]|uniref:ATP-dependent DNA helicase n=1 Tax=Microbacterium sp. 4R-513 TaxID=2567934 RepID=UPI0013E1AADC|nr:ATP-dependent DNA helicase [Microbacterium sp. 4R-513]QIG40310.1 ATP-dependent helicase [Microbacterium sp. 4R-513]